MEAAGWPGRPERARSWVPAARARGCGRPRWPAAALAALLLLPVAAVSAQEDGPGGHRKWLGAAIGAVAVGIPVFLAGDFNPGLGGCARKECFAPVATAVGFTVGFLLGKEFDDAAARRFVAGPRLEILPRETVRLPFPPGRARAADGKALLTGSGGLISLAGATGTPLPGPRGALDAALVGERSAIVAATATGLFALPAGRGGPPGRRVDARGAHLVAAGGGGAVVAAGAGGLLGFATRGEGAGLRLSETARATGGRVAADLLWPEDSRILWALEGARLVAREGGTLAEVGALELSGTARSLDIDGPLGVVAAGSGGVHVIDVSDPAAPVLAARYQGVRTARDAALLASRAYIAAGEQGLVVLDLARPGAPEVAAVARNLGSPSLVLRASGKVWVVDGTTGDAHWVSLPAAAPPANHTEALPDPRGRPPSDR